jgi:hypothetical protein
MYPCHAVPTAGRPQADAAVHRGSDAPALMALDGAALESLELLENSAGGTAGETGALVAALRALLMLDCG